MDRGDQLDLRGDAVVPIGTVLLHTKFRVDVGRLRAELDAAVTTCPPGDGRVATLRVSDASAHATEVCILVSARNAPRAWNLHR